MSSIYNARYSNALKIANKINSLLKKGFIIFDEDGRKVKGFIITEVGDILEKVSDNCTIAHFINDKNSDNGYCTPIKEFNEYYKDWTFINPKDIHKLMEEIK